MRIITTARVNCTCGKRVTIRTDKPSVKSARQCWLCGNYVYFTMSGNSVEGRVWDGTHTHHTGAQIIQREEA